MKLPILDKLVIERGVAGSVTGGLPPVQVGVIGLGRSFFGNHLPALAALRDHFRVVALCDLEKGRRDLAAETFPEAHHYREASDLMDDTEMELLFIAVPSVHHEKMSLANLRHRRWTVTETPLSFTYEGVAKMRAAAAKARDRLVPCVPEMFSPEFRLVCRAMQDRRIGPVYDIRIRRQRWERRSDWQTLNRCGGGMVRREGLEAALQTMRLLHTPPTQLWSELKRIASAGDAEDYMRFIFRGHGQLSADVEITGGQLDPAEPAFSLRGELGGFRVMPGAKEGVLRFLDPAYKLPRRRASVQTPPLKDPVDETPMVEEKLRLDPGEPADAARAFWLAVFDWVRRGRPFPVSLDDVAEATRYLQIARQSSPFAG